MRARLSLGRELTLAALGGALLAVVMQWPLPLHLGSDVAKDLGDPLAQAWQVAWGGHALLHQPLRLFDSNQFYPLHDTLAFSDALVGYAPAGAIGSGPAAAVARYDLLVLFAYALAFLGAYALARVLRIGRACAVVAGAAFAFTPWRLEQAGHLHVISSGGIPLALALLVWGWRRRRPWAVLGGWVVATWQLSLGWTLGLQLAYLLAVLGVVAIVREWRARRTRGVSARGDREATWLPKPAGGGREAGARAEAARRTWPDRGLLVATAAGALLFAAVGVLLGRVYLHVADTFPQAARGPRTVAYYSGGPVELLAAGRDSLVWSGITAAARARVNTAAEQSLFPGLTILLLAALGAWRGPWSRALRTGLAIGVVATAVLALGFADAGHRWLYPYGWLYALPGWSAVRTPGRLMTLTTLGLALLAAAGAQRLAAPRGPVPASASPGAARPAAAGAGPAAAQHAADGEPPARATARRWLPWALTALILLEGCAFSLHGGRLSGPPHPRVEQPPPGLAAARAPLLELPLGAFDNRRYLLWSTAGFPALVNGRSSLNPPSFLRLNTELRAFPDVATVAQLRALGVRTVVLHRAHLAGTPWAAWASRRTPPGVSRELRDGVVLYRLAPG
jgi:hypothetical protein